MYFLWNMVNVPAIYVSFSGGVCIPTQKEMPPTPQGEKNANVHDSTDPTGVSLQKVTSVAAQQLNQLAAVGHAAPWALKDGGMVGWLVVAAVMVGVGVMKHEIGTHFGWVQTMQVMVILRDFPYNDALFGLLISWSPNWQETFSAKKYPTTYHQNQNNFIEISM